MSSLLGFIQLLLVLVPVGKKQHKAVITKQHKITTHSAVIIEAEEGSTSTNTILPQPFRQAASPGTSHDDKGIPAAPFSILTILFIDFFASGQSFSNKPFRSCALYILYCQLKSDC